MTHKPINPYTRLLSEIKNFCYKVENPRTKKMWFYPKDKLNKQWQLSDLYERVRAADQLDYEVKLIADDQGLQVMYVEETPETPYEWRY